MPSPAVVFHHARKCKKRVRISGTGELLEASPDLDCSSCKEATIYLELAYTSSVHSPQATSGRGGGGVLPQITASQMYCMLP